jgi:hypothetical protein
MTTFLDLLQLIIKVSDYMYVAELVCSRNQNKFCSLSSVVILPKFYTPLLSLFSGKSLPSWPSLILALYSHHS